MLQFRVAVKKGGRGLLYSMGLSRQRMLLADVTMENSRDKRVNILLLLLVLVRDVGRQEAHGDTCYLGPFLPITQGPRAVFWVLSGGVTEH